MSTGVCWTHAAHISMKTVENYEISLMKVPQFLAILDFLKGHFTGNLVPRIPKTSKLLELQKNLLSIYKRLFSSRFLKF